MKKFNQSILATAMLLAAGGANAAAFQLAEVSTSGLGRAYAGEAAIADNAAVIATNPALMTVFKRAQFSTGGVYINSKVDMRGDVESKINAVQGHNKKGSASKNDVVPEAFIPNLYFVTPVNDKLALGAGMNVNFGLKSEYGRDYDAGLFGGETKLSTINLNFSGAYRVTQGLSVGLGLNAVHAKAKLDRTAGILKKIADTARSGSLSTVLSQFKPLTDNLTSKDKSVVQLQDKSAWGFGWNAGVMYQFNENNRMGLAYHSAVDIDFTDYTATSLKASKFGEESSLTLRLPDYVEFSGLHQVTNRFAIHYSYKYTHWSHLNKLYARYNDGKAAFDKELQYSNSSRVAFGGTYDIDDKLTLRAGVAYDQAASRHYRTASIPDTDRTWYSLGATYKFTPHLSVDFGYAYLKGKTINFKEEEKAIQGQLTTTANYTSKAHANLYGLNLNYSF
ncbi:Outer membrane protein P1 [Haemophilus influenzae]|uniref:Outer membrane protein P1 n=1 Tax=Haemophilus influenzae TaxID=727 RepID=A0AAX3IUA5_HAEIF|nr:OmpP1/FadL family transporter [Haemophilus influenzae]VTX70464.1 Outer membrane protein P1 [Haemophilus influenzae]